ncbi:MAG TPA: DUF484 domain-containing protein [Gammaproteobacteria bacterium]|nr:DUF484 domain-containing protein [Gammaproteobacteria bacterium]
MDRAVSEEQDALKTLGTPDFEQKAVAWLRDHPEFFTDHPELAEELRIPHPCRPAVSLLEYQNRLLREHVQRLHDKLIELVNIARDNDRLAERVQRLALGLLDARGGLDELLHGVKAILREEFKADCVALCLAVPPTVGLSEVEELLRPDVVGLFDEIFRAGRPQCGRLSLEQAAALFGDSAYHAVSAALIPLDGNQWRGLLAVGSGDPNRFHPGVGTLFLERIGQLVSQALQARLLAEGWRAAPDPPSVQGG